MQSSDRSVYAMLMAVVGVLSIAASDLITKNITNLVSLWQILLLRSVIALLLLLVLLTLSKQLHRIRPVSLRHLNTRNFLMAISYLLFLAGLAIMPVAVVAGGFFSAPFFTVLFAWWMLGEHIGAWRIGSVIVGFIGVLLILRPDTAGADATLLLPVLGAMFYSLTQVYTRKYCQSEKSLAVSFWLAACFMLTGLLGVLLIAYVPALQGDAFYNTPYAPPSTQTWLTLGAIAVASLLAHYALAAAYQNAAASVIGPLEYLYLPIASLGGMLFFDETPSISAIVGIALILLVGLVITWREQRLKKLSMLRAKELAKVLHP